MTDNGAMGIVILALIVLGALAYFYDKFRNKD